MNTRLLTLKSILWALVGMLGVVSIARFFHGLGATTNLTDATPWGIWIGFDVMGGVALAAGGFVLAATLYIFGLEKYRPFVRPAILTAFLGYIAVATGLVYDLGLPWNIWHPMLFPQHHSVLFEVAMCVMIYLTVLALEFAPVVLEHKWFVERPLFATIHKILKSVTIPLVIAGIILSTLHQSSLGSLFLIAPYRVHPLWYSQIIYLLFFISATGLGLMMVCMESLLTAYFFRHRLRTDLMSGLGLAAAVVLGLYAAVRIGDLAVQGKITHAFDGSWQANLFWVEMSLSAIIPAIMLSFRNVRSSVAGLVVCSTITVIGMVMYRIDLSVVTFLRPDGQSYFPTWIELAVSVGIVSAAALAFIFFAENFKVYIGDDEHEGDPKAFPRPMPQSAAWLGGIWNSAPRRYSMAAIAGASLAIAFLPRNAVMGPSNEARAVPAPLTLKALETQRPEKGHQFTLIGGEFSPVMTGQMTNLMLLGNDESEARPAFFPHDDHVKGLGEESCVTCHHMNMPLDTNTSCTECHRDMLARTDLFNHEFHIESTGGNEGCQTCHYDNSKPKTSETAASCSVCHEEMVAEHAFARTPLAGEAKELERFAPSYKQAMHELCITCHEEELRADPQAFPADLARCDSCHRIAPESLENLKPTPKKVTQKQVANIGQ